MPILTPPLCEDTMRTRPHVQWKPGREEGALSDTRYVGALLPVFLVSRTGRNTLLLFKPLIYSTVCCFNSQRKPRHSRNHILCQPRLSKESEGLLWRTAPQWGARYIRNTCLLQVTLVFVLFTGFVFWILQSLAYSNNSRAFDLFLSTLVYVLENIFSSVLFIRLLLNLFQMLIF